MIENNVVLERYFQILRNKIAKYINPEFIEKYNLMKTHEKIELLNNIQKDLDESLILKDNFQFKNDPIVLLIKKIYQFLFTEKNYFDNNSYMQLLILIHKAESEDIIKKIVIQENISEIEKTFINSIMYDLKQLEKNIEDKTIQNQVKFLRKINNSVLTITCSAILALSLMGCYTNSDKNHIKIKPTQNEIKNSESNIQRMNYEEWLEKQNTPHMLTNAANFMMIADTCSAWAIINSIENINLRATVTIEYADTIRLSSISGNNEETRKRFELLCTQAVNYTIQEYPKFTSLNINKYLNNVKIIVINDPNLEDDGWFDHNHKESIYINIARFTQAPIGSAPFIIFNIIAHESIHMLYKINYPTININEIGKININKSESLHEYFEQLRKPTDTTHIISELEKYRQQSILTEKEAYTFGIYLINKLFNNLITDKHIAESYYNHVLEIAPNDTLKNNIMFSIWNIHSTREDYIKNMEKVSTGEYNSINQNVERIKQQLIKRGPQIAFR